MRPITVELTPTEALNLVGLLDNIAKAREKRGWKADVTRRIAGKVDAAIHVALEGEHEALTAPSET